MDRRRTCPGLLIVGPVVVVLATGCGGSGPRESTGAQEVEPAVEPDDSASQAGQGMAVEGILGSIPAHKVSRVMERNMEGLEQCYGDALDGLDVIEGSFELVIVVDLDGSVYQSFMRDGNLGSLEAESCMLGKIARYNFPKPGGGRAEVSHALDLEAPYDPPEPLNWSGAEIDQVVDQHRDDLERCLGGRVGVQLTVYVGSGGRVVSSGATAGEFELYEAAQCLAEAATAWEFPDPGGETAKASVSF